MKRVWIVLILLLLLVACNKNEPTPSTPSSANVHVKIVDLIGGLGSNQLSSDMQAQIDTIPNVDVVNVSNWNGYNKDNYTAILTEKVKYVDSDIYIIGHSFGGDAGIQVATKLGENGYMVKRMYVFDPVKISSGDRLYIPGNVGDFVWYKPTRWTIFIESGDVTGGTYILLNGDHNSITHDTKTISKIVSEISSD